MSQSVEGLSRSFKAAADLSAKQHLFVKLDTTANQIAVAGAGDKILGILEDDPPSGAAGKVRISGGTTKLVVDGSGTAIAIGDYLKSDASGRGVKTTVDRDKVGAMALAASSAAGDIIEVLVLPPGTERSTA